MLGTGKKFIMMTVAVMMLMSIDAFGTGQDEGGKTEVEKDIEIEILWQQEVTEEFWDEAIIKFNKLHPNVKVNFNLNPRAYEVIRNRLVAEDAPDIFFTWISEFDYFGAAEEGLLSPIDDIINEKNYEEDKLLRELLSSSGLQLGKINGKHYFLPLGKFLTVPYYSKTLFDQQGYTVPETWDDLYSLSSKILADGLDPIVYAGAYPFMLSDGMLWSSIYNINPDAIDRINNHEVGAWLDPAVLETFKNLEKLVKKNYVARNSLAYDHIQSQMEFINNRAAIIPAGTWLEGEMAGQWSENFNLEPMLPPSAVNGMNSIIALTEVMVLPKTKDYEKKLPYLKDLIKIFYSKEIVSANIKKASYVVALENLDPDDEKYLPSSVTRTWALAARSNVTILSPEFRLKKKSVFIEYNNYINALVAGEITAEEFVKKMDEEVMKVQ